VGAERGQTADRSRQPEQSEKGWSFSMLDARRRFATLPVMSRAMRVEYPGAICHVMDRGTCLRRTTARRNPREHVFVNDADRHDLVQTLAKACEKTGWQIHAYCWKKEKGSNRRFVQLGGVQKFSSNLRFDPFPAPFTGAARARHSRFWPRRTHTWFPSGNTSGRLVRRRPAPEKVSSK
jgi:hypothetical protein